MLPLKRLINIFKDTLMMNKVCLVLILSVLIIVAGCGILNLNTIDESIYELEVEDTPMRAYETKEIITAVPNTPKKSEEVSNSPTVTGSPTKTPVIDLANLQVENPSIVIRKADRKLDLYSNDILITAFDIGLGFTPIGDKEVEGDGKTPEGEFYICVKNPNSRYYLSLGVSYPTSKDAKRGLDAGLITEDTYSRIEYADEHKQLPPWNTPLGGEIMIHGEGAGRDWTAGCIAVDNDVIDMLFRVCDIGVIITILP